MVRNWRCLTGKVVLVQDKKQVGTELPKLDPDLNPGTHRLRNQV